MLLNILLGLCCLSIVVLIHEAGHFIAAKASGIDVEVFSIGWGKPIFKIRRGNTDYAISPIPLGGYCKMKGEAIFQQAVENNSTEVDYEKGSLFSAGPVKRIITYLAGPLSNFIFAVAAMTTVWLIGFSVLSYDSKIVLLSDYPAFSTMSVYPADKAGLETGDVVTAVNGKAIESFSDFQTAVAPRAEEDILLTVTREGMELEIPIRPDLNKETGAGVIGVSAWIEPVIGEVREGGSAHMAGLMKGDRIMSVNGTAVDHHLDVYDLLEKNRNSLEIGYLRDGLSGMTRLTPRYDENGMLDIGLSFAAREFRSPDLGFFGALARGTSESVSTFYLTLKSIGLFFRGLKPGKVISGPIRITVIAGEIASAGFEAGFGAGLINLLRLMSLFSVALCFMNILPIPALDGGMIVINIVEMIKGRSVSPRTFYRYQMIGVVFIILLLFFATFSDITFLTQR